MICEHCDSRGPFELDHKESIFENYQRIVVQEPPSGTEAGRLPRSKEVILIKNLVNSCRPGDEVRVVGVYMHKYDYNLNIRMGFPVFSTMIMANNIIKDDEESAMEMLTEQDKKDIKTLSKRPDLDELIFNSIAPSIYGHFDVKRAITMALFGGVEKVTPKHRVRGDINLLMCGDPGTAKSQFLKCVKKLAPRCIFTTGQGASAVGLTAFVTKNFQTKEWSLEAGAMVLADRGYC